MDFQQIKNVRERAREQYRRYSMLIGLGIPGYSVPIDLAQLMNHRIAMLLGPMQKTTPADVGGSHWVEDVEVSKLEALERLTEEARIEIDALEVHKAECIAAEQHRQHAARETAFEQQAAGLSLTDAIAHLEQNGKRLVIAVQDGTLGIRGGGEPLGLDAAILRRHFRAIRQYVEARATVYALDASKYLTE